MKVTKDRVAAVAVAAVFCLATPRGALAETKDERETAAKAEPRHTFTREELPGPPVPEEVAIPPGTRSDVFLWKQAIDWQNDLVIQRGQAEALLRKFYREKHDGRLVGLKAPDADKERILEVRKHLGFAWKDVSDLMSRQWPVDTRLGCRMQFQDLGGAMEAAPGSFGASSLAEARVELVGCLRKVQGVLEPLQKANQKLTAAFAEADAVLVAAPADPGTAGSQPGAK